jgi:hypothetical protein
MRVCRGSTRHHHPRGTAMLDLIFLAAGLAFFAAGLGYTLLCDRL